MLIEAAVLLLHVFLVQALAAERVEGAQRDYQIMELQVGQASFILASCSTLLWCPCRFGSSTRPSIACVALPSL